MKKAAIEMGTNSTRLLIAEVSDNEIKSLKKDLITTRLGEGVDKNKILNESAIKRGLKALQSFQEQIKDYEVKDVRLVGTSALRDVKNGDQFQKLVKDNIGYNLEIISGKKEAELIFKGVTYGYDFDDYIIIDIGGGSTEFIWKSSAFEKVKMDSLDLGAVRLTERFIESPEQSISEQIVNEVSEFVKKEIQTAVAKLPTIDNLIGVGGTITTMATILLKAENYSSKAVHDYGLNFKEIDNILKKLSKLPIHERKQVKGLNPDRADIIVAGVIILKEIMKSLNTEQLRVSDNDILEGLLIEA
jgi:exopolyphosphatase/guanosine-5'-triphosphate,3'-diphosphate pyrophosphatase